MEYLNTPVHEIYMYDINIINKNSHAKGFECWQILDLKNFIFNITFNREQYTKSNIIL